MIQSSSWSSSVSLVFGNTPTPFMTPLVSVQTESIRSFVCSDAFLTHESIQHAQKTVTCSTATAEGERRCGRPPILSQNVPQLKSKTGFVHLTDWRFPENVSGGLKGKTRGNKGSRNLDFGSRCFSKRSSSCC